MQELRDPHALAVDAVTKILGTDLEYGLADDAASRLLAERGRNELPKAERPSRLFGFLKQFHNVFSYVLFGAAALSILVGEAGDAIGIFVAMLIRAVFGFVQERRAEDAIAKLAEMVVEHATVVREGRTKRIETALVVPGDVILLSEGDRIPADARLIDARELTANEASLTGESSAVRKSAEPIPAETAMNDRRNMVWMGTVVATGSARAIVTETGPRTAFGRIAVSLNAIRRPKTPLETRMDSLARKLGTMAVILAAIVYLLGQSKGYPVLDMILFSVAMIVSVVPEGLPAVLAIVLAIGTWRMAQRRAIIRHVPSVETLGITDIICTDKTGTLTENKMTVREIVTTDLRISVSGEGWEPKGDFTSSGKRVLPAEERQLSALLIAGTLANRASLEWREGRAAIVGDPTEGAIVVAAAKGGLERQHLAAEYRLLDEIPFSSDRRYRATLCERTDLRGEKVRFLFVIGAYDSVFPRCGSVSEGEAPIDAAVRRRFDEENDRMAGAPLRVIAVASKEVSPALQSIGDKDIGDLSFCGLVGMMDPPRVGVADAIERCRNAGVRVIMITGDQRPTALAIAREIGLVNGEGGERRVFSERDVAGMDDRALDRTLADAAIFARVSPDTKLRIVTRLEAMGHVVAMTGDGVNDAPALKKASIGIAMGITGTAVAKDVADMVLADDNFISIVSAIVEGRIVFRNVKQTTAYLFMTNVGEVVTILGSLLVGLPIPLLPTQILWMNLITDGLPDIALSTEGVHGDVLADPPRKRDAPVITKGVLFMSLLTSLTMCLGTLYLFRRALAGGDLEYAQTIAFTAMAVFQLWNVFSMRSTRKSLFQLGLFTNFYVVLAVVASFMLQLAALYLPLLQGLFHTVPLGMGDWLMIMAVTSSVFVVIECYKFALRRGLIPAHWY